MSGSGDRGRGRARSPRDVESVLLLMQGIVQEAFALLLRRQLGGECLAEFMQIFCVMCSSPYQNFGDRANVFGQAVFDNLEHTRIPRRRRSRMPRLCRGVFLLPCILSQR